MKMTVLPQNTFLVQQVQTYIDESNVIIRNSQYRKSIMVLDTYYKKLLPIESPTLLRCQVLRRLCYCSIKYFQLKINKSECNQRKNAFILWNRFLFYIRDYHDHILMIKKKAIKSFYIQELIRFIFQSNQCKSMYYWHNSLQAKGILAFHISIQSYLPKIAIVPQLFLVLGQEILQSGSLCFQLQYFQQAEKNAESALDYFHKSLLIAYEQNILQSPEKMKLALNKTIKLLILSLYQQILIFEATQNYKKYIEAIRLLVWFDENFQGENSMAKAYLIPQLDINKYNLYIIEQLEISKILQQVIKPNEKKQYFDEEVEHFNEKLFNFDCCDNLHKTYFVFQKQQSSQVEFYSETESIKHIKNNSIANQRTKDLENITETTSLFKSPMKMKSEQNSTRIQTENDQIQSTQISYRKPKKKLENLTLNQFYGQVIEQSCQLEAISMKPKKCLTEQDTNDIKIFDKKCLEQKGKLQFLRIYGDIGGYSFRKARLSKRQESKQLVQSVKLQQCVVNSQEFIKRCSEQVIITQQFNLKRNQSSTLLQSKQELFVPSQRKLTLNEKDDEEVEKQMTEQSKQIIKKYMAEKEAQFDSKNHMQNRKTSNLQLHSLSNALLHDNGNMALTTYNISNQGKKINSLKSLLDVSGRKTLVPQKRGSTTVINKEYLEKYKPNSQTRILS